MRHNPIPGLPQFYNINLEIHKDEPNGPDCLVVDATKKGNFARSVAHSCNPNCGTVSTVSDGIYYVGIYAFKDISYGEELTIEYCSNTDS